MAIIDPYRFAAGSPPTAFSGCTFWFDARSGLYTNSESDGGVAVVAEDDEIGFAISQATDARCGHRVVDAGRPLYKPGSVSGNAAALFDGSNDRLQIQQRTGLNAGTALAVSDIIGADTYTMAAAVRIVTATNAGASGYAVHCIANDTGGFFALSFANVDASTALARAACWDGADKFAEVGVNKMEWIVLGVTHTGSAIRLRLNGGTWDSTAAGAITSLTGTPQIGGGDFGAYANVDVVEFCTFDTLLSDADLLLVEKYFGSLIGVTI